MHEKIVIQTCSGEVHGIAPLVISASRATDIPAFHTAWFMQRLNQGYCVRANPFNRKQLSYISFARCKGIIFWSKNPEPLIPCLDAISAKGMRYYFHYTINDYEKERLEPNVPELGRRIETFIRLSEQIGKEKLIWRYDPILLTDELSISDHLNRIDGIGRILSPYAAKLVFSFADIRNYPAVARNLKKYAPGAREAQSDERWLFAQKLAELNAFWKNPLPLATCAESDDLSALGISRNKCVDEEMLCQLCPHDTGIVAYYGKTLRQAPLPGNAPRGAPGIKDKGQRRECGCALSKDIGAYNTCPHLCAYCYANHSEKAVWKNVAQCSAQSESLSGV